ncbi:MAG: carboxylating nicotinate-nucleotide diphosphorylase [Frankiales bacterium]|nr:carboxylating nicotinate-nucleotide diphosphorylase [Frankiales bacterium]
MTDHESSLNPVDVRDVVRRTLIEDLGGGLDVTSVATISHSQRSTGAFVTRQAGVVCGLPLVEAALQEVAGIDVAITRLHRDGDRVQAGEELLRVSGATRGLLTAERTALNLLGHLSGVATLTRQWADAIQGTGARVRDTRKTLPGLRGFQKYAVRCGGGLNHRMSLSDAALIKDNHVAAAGSITAAIDAVRAQFPTIPLEVECDTLAQVDEAVAAGAKLILLDNMPVSMMREAVGLVSGRARLEASGGLTLSSARAVAETGVDYLAVGALTHSAPQLDIGFDLR